MEKVWNVEMEGDEEEGSPSLRARVKRFTMSDGLQKTQLERDLTVSAEKTPDAEIKMLYLVNNYPLLKFGIREAEGFALPLTEEAFWKLPEQFVILLVEKIREANPQYNIPFLALMQLHKSDFPQDTEETPTTTSETEPTDK
jgi:hypothetical protein